MASTATAERVSDRVLMLRAEPDLSDYTALVEADVDWVLVHRAVNGDAAAKRALNDAEWTEVVRLALVVNRWTVTDTALKLATRNTKIRRIADAAQLDYRMYAPGEERSW